MSEIDVYKEWLGIPEGDRPPDYYTLLRLREFEDDEEKIRGNYRKLNAHVRKYATGQYLKQSQALLNELAKAMLCLTDPDGKREYDESRGREFKPASADGAETLLEFLVARGDIKRGQVSEIQHFADARGLNHRDAVIQMKLADPQTATQGYAAELRMSYIDLDDMLPEDEVLDQLPRNVVKRHTCLPLFEDRGRLLVACADEPSHELEDEVRLRFGVPMRAVLALPRSINQAIARYYAPGVREESQASKPDRKKSGTPAAGRPAAKKATSGPLGEEELAKRKQITYIATCWSIMAVVGAFHFGTESGVGVTAIIAALAAGGAVFGLMSAVWWK